MIRALEDNGNLNIWEFDCFRFCFFIAMFAAAFLLAFNVILAVGYFCFSLVFTLYCNFKIFFVSHIGGINLCIQ